MRKNLLDKTVAQEIIDRANALTLETAGKWGKMNATEMLAHCNLINQTMLDGTLPYKRTTPVQFVARFLFLNLIPKFPRNLKIPAENTTKGKVAREKFEAEKARFIGIMQTFTERQAIAVTHPAFGNLNAEELGKLTWMHMDHHLRQFGV